MRGKLAFIGAPARRSWRSWLSSTPTDLSLQECAAGPASREARQQKETLAWFPRKMESYELSVYVWLCLCTLMTYESSLAESESTWNFKYPVTFVLSLLFSPKKETLLAPP